MNKDIIKETLNILFDNVKIYIIIFFVFFVPLGIFVGIFLLILHFFGQTVANYTILGLVAVGFLWMIDAIAGWVRRTYQQAKINLRNKK